MTQANTAWKIPFYADAIGPPIPFIAAFATLWWANAEANGVIWLGVLFLLYGLGRCALWVRVIHRNWVSVTSTGIHGRASGDLFNLQYEDILDVYWWEGSGSPCFSPAHIFPTLTLKTAEQVIVVDLRFISRPREWFARRKLARHLREHGITADLKREDPPKWSWDALGGPDLSWGEPRQ